MNERIKSIADKVWSLNIDPNPQFNQCLQEFAELIIQDIGQIVSGLIVPETWEQDIGPYEHWNRALGTVALEIEQHFYGEAE
jgi:hypothetical protein